MILFISTSGESLPIAWRIRQEGGDARIYIHSPTYRHNYDGIIEKVSAARLPGMVKKAKAVIFDILRPNEDKREDKALLRIFKIKGDVPEIYGAVADKLRKQYPDKLIIGASSETATWELDRYKGEKIAKKIGFHVPETYRFSTLKEGARFLKNRKDRWVFKPLNNQDLDLTYVEKFPGDLYSKLTGEYVQRLGNKIDYILQKVIEGVELSTELWWDGQDFVHFNHTIEDKRLMNNNLGPAIGSQSNTVWVKKNPEGFLVRELTRLAPLLKKAGYVGPIDVNCIVSEEDHQPYFLEWSCRMGWDAFYCLLSLLKGKITDFFLNRFKVAFHDGYASSQRITIPPFPYADKGLLADLAKGVEIKYGFEDPLFWAEDVKKEGDKVVCAGADGILGVMAARGHSIGGSVGNMYRAIKKLKIASYLQYRTDGGRRAERDIPKLKKWGVNIE